MFTCGTPPPPAEPDTTKPIYLLMNIFENECNVFARGKKDLVYCGLGCKVRCLYLDGNLFELNCGDRQLIALRIIILP